jgi:hypothetical protein
MARTSSPAPEIVRAKLGNYLPREFGFRAHLIGR